MGGGRGPVGGASPHPSPIEPPKQRATVQIAGSSTILGPKASQSAGIVDPLRAPAQKIADRDRIKALAQRFLAERGASSAERAVA